MRLLRLLPPLVWAGLIFYLSSVPGGVGGSEWQAIAGHIAFFGALAYLLARALDPFRGKAPRYAVALMAWALTVLYGLSDEWHQSFVAGRTADPVDVVWDGLGAALALLVWLGVEWLLTDRLPRARSARQSR